MRLRLFALIFGIALIIIGILGFIPALHTAPAANAPSLAVVSKGYGNLFSLFPINYVENGFFIVVGIIGVLVAARYNAARIYARGVFLVFGLLTVMGFVPTLDVVFGLAPVFGDDTWLYAGCSLVASYFGFVEPEPTDLAPAPHHAIVQH